MACLQDKENKINGRWTKIQHEKFLLGIELYGKNWKKIEEIIGTRNGSQIRSHAQKFFLKSKKNFEGPENSEMVHDTNENMEPLTVISKSSSSLFEAASDTSFFMDQIMKTSPFKPNFNFWRELIDVKEIKMENEEVHESRRKDSFVTFEGMGDSKHETPISNPQTINDF